MDRDLLWKCHLSGKCDYFRFLPKFREVFVGLSGSIDRIAAVEAELDVDKTRIFNFL